MDQVLFVKVLVTVLILVLAALAYYVAARRHRFWFAQHMKTAVGLIVFVPLMIVAVVLFSSVFLLLIVGFLVLVVVGWLLSMVFGWRRGL